MLCCIHGQHLHEAIRIGESLVDASKNAFGDNHPDVIMRGGNLAGYLNDASKHQEAEKVLREVCAAAEEVFGDQDLKLAGYLSKLGWTLRYQENFADSFPIFKRAEEIYQEQLGSDDLQTKEARRDWLVSYKQAGEPITPEEEKEFWKLHKELDEAKEGSD
jgi:tetratricopeptide (TPR) repeat protein